MRALVLMLALAAEPQLTGTWKGTSLCTVKPSACHDEVVVYHVRAGAKAGAFVVQANKVVDGKEEDMGTLDCAWTAAKHELACAIPKGVFRFTIDGARLKGTLTLTDGTLFRTIEAEKVSADAGS